MIRLFKKNRILFVLIIFTITTFIFGILFNSFIDIESKNIISNNISGLINNLNNDNISNFNNFISLFISNSLILFIIFILGISIIGMIFIYVIYLLKVFIYGFEFVSLLSYLKLNNIIYILIYFIPSIIFIFIFLFITYYGLSFSFMLFRHLFIDKSINIKKVFIGYLRVFLVSLFMCFINCIFEILFIPKVLLFLF